MNPLKNRIAACCVFFSFFFTLSSFGQDADTLKLRENALNIFLDCDWDCDMTYIRQNMTMVNYMRDQKDADVYIMVVSQRTGSGGDEYQLRFEGQGKFDGQSGEIKYTNPGTNTNDENRIAMVKHLQAGLLPYISQTPLFDKMTIQFDDSAKAEEVKPEEVEDKWNNWLYSINVGGWMSGQASFRQFNGWSSVNARRVTETWKLSFSLSGNTNRQVFVNGDSEDVYTREGYGFYSYVIRAINDHWSVGVNQDLFTSTFSNLELANDFGPALEYNLFPYQESAVKQMRFIYRPYHRYHIYEDTTIYNKKKEHLFGHRFEIAYETQAKWGSVDAAISTNQYFHDPSLYNVELDAGINIRIVKGLNVRLSGNVALIRDQVALKKFGASDEEVLLQQRELATNYSYWGNFGINYTFGSIYNNVVFPRFGGGL